MRGKVDGFAKQRSEGFGKINKISLSLSLSLTVKFCGGDSLLVRVYNINVFEFLHGFEEISRLFFKAYF
jgi:hypothetical protein